MPTSVRLELFTAERAVLMTLENGSMNCTYISKPNNDGLLASWPLILGHGGHLMLVAPRLRARQDDDVAVRSTGTRSRGGSPPSSSWGGSATRSADGQLFGRISSRRRSSSTNEIAEITTTAASVTRIEVSMISISRR